MYDEIENKINVTRKSKFIVEKFPVSNRYQIIIFRYITLYYLIIIYGKRAFYEYSLTEERLRKTGKENEARLRYDEF